MADVQGNLSSEKLIVPAENWDVKPGDTIVIPGDQEKIYEVLKVAFQPKTGQLIPASYSVELRFIP
ncbi:hypothetical protein VO64_0300 [Pseudomonas synxantha]|uniref:Uncharacterized protein n=1 Tax=Pseudomonas synxantha TaxID=47883 RepID=A0AAU8TFC8_9PSED|nr:hypothetical protein VO64_0288 [Pseudomonas synxantha]AKA80846.1 hypothetical protein VO64_0300 [Pseudomonas synxantha]